MTLPHRHPLVLVAAVARNGVIGLQGRMPWHLPGDLVRFRQLTIGHPLLMGRKTYEAIGRPLPDRLTTVLSSAPAAVPAGVSVAHTLPLALESADHQADSLGAPSVMVVGGGQIYAATIASAQTLLITEVDLQPDGDAWFPTIDPGRWRKSETVAASPTPGDSAGYHFTRWDRIEPDVLGPSHA